MKFRYCWVSPSYLGPTPSQEDVFAEDNNFEEDRDNDNEDKGSSFKKPRFSYGLSSFDSSDEEWRQLGESDVLKGEELSV
jgi:hypothetical protein